MKRLNYLCLVGLLFVSAASAARGESIEWIRQLGTSGMTIAMACRPTAWETSTSRATPRQPGRAKRRQLERLSASTMRLAHFQWTRQLGTISSGL